MATHPAAQVEEVLDRLEKAAIPPDSDSLAEIVKQVAQLFRVAEDEVAIMEIAPSGRTCALSGPERLAPGGIDPAFQQLGSGCAHGTRTPLGHYQQFLRLPAMPAFSKAYTWGGATRRPFRRS